MKTSKIRYPVFLLFMAVVVLFCATTPYANAQTYGGVSGTVQDTARAVIQAAKVTAVNINTSASITATTGSEGFYTFPNLPVGTYRITAESTGFQKEVQNDVVVSVDTPLRLDFTLSPGGVTQSVEVISQALAIDTTSATLGNTMDSRQIANLPINGRDYARFSLLTPGAVARSNYIADLSFDGLHTVHNQFSIDGVDASRVDQPYMANGYERGARLLTGSLETVAEFKVQTSDYQAQYGRAAGSIVGIVTKSGSTKFTAKYTTTSVTTRSMRRTSSLSRSRNFASTTSVGTLRGRSATTRPFIS